MLVAISIDGKTKKQHSLRNLNDQIVPKFKKVQQFKPINKNPMTFKLSKRRKILQSIYSFNKYLVTYFFAIH